VFGRSRSSVTLFFGEKRFQFLAAIAQWSTVFCYSVAIGVSRIHTIHNIIGKRRNNHVYFCPVVQARVLLLVEAAYFLILDGFELWNTY
jgi:hypothetical protein